MFILKAIEDHSFNVNVLFILSHQPDVSYAKYKTEEYLMLSLTRLLATWVIEQKHDGEEEEYGWLHQYQF